MERVQGRGYPEIGPRVHCWGKPNAVCQFMIANGAVVGTLFYGLGAYYFGKGVEEFARPFAIALAVLGAIVVRLDGHLLAAQGTGAC